MIPFSESLTEKLGALTVSVPESRPRTLFGQEEVAGIRKRARMTAGTLDALRAAADGAANNQQLFGDEPEIPYLLQGPVRALADAAFVLEDAGYAARALAAVEVMFGFPPEEWVARPHRPMRCDHAMLNVASCIGLVMDMCAPYWGDDVVRSVSERIDEYTVSRFLETWEKQDAHWAQPDYHWNWKIMCCGEMGSAAIACAPSITSLDEVLRAALAGCLDILDCVPAEGDWAEGPGYWMATLGHGLRFGLALAHATGDAVDLFEHPALKVTGDHIVHVTEPDGMVYNFNDNGIGLGASLDYLSLLAKRHRRGDWARTARQSAHVSVEGLAWDDPGLPDEVPDDTAGSYPTTGIVLMRSGWDDQATFVGMKSGRSDVGHSQLDANSIVVSSRGERMLIDEGKWPYAHFLGFFEHGGRRENFDGNATLGHSTLLVDGKGQKDGKQYPGKIVSFEAGLDVDVAVAEAAPAYGDLLEQYTRTLVFIKPDDLLVYDQVAAKGERYLEWLFHHTSEASGDETLTELRQNGVVLSITRVLPEEAECWRVSDVARTSAYTSSNAFISERVTVRYRSFGPFHQTGGLDALWALNVGDGSARPAVTAETSDGAVAATLRWPDGTEKTVSIPRS